MIQFIIVFSSFHLVKSFHVAIWTIMIQWSRWYISIFDGLVFSTEHPRIIPRFTHPVLALDTKPGPHRLVQIWNWRQLLNWFNRVWTVRIGHSLLVVFLWMCKNASYFCNGVVISAGHLLWIYRQLIGMSYIALARQVQIYRNISDPLGRLGSWLFWYIVLQLAPSNTSHLFSMHCNSSLSREVEKTNLHMN